MLCGHSQHFCLVSNNEQEGKVELIDLYFKVFKPFNNRVQPQLILK